MTVAPEPKFGLADLASFNKRSIRDAGERYFPDCNLKIEPLDEAIIGLVGGGEFRASVKSLARAICEKWGDTSREMNLNAPPKPKQILHALDTLANSTPGGGGEAIVKARQGIERACKRVGELYNEYEEKDSESSPKEKQEKKKTLRNLLDLYSDALSEAKQFLSGASPSDYGVYDLPNACGLHEKGALLMSGEWGVGKTHSLCALVDKQMKRGLPALLVLAESFDPGECPGDALARRTGLAGNLDGLLRGLNALGRKSGVRTLLLIDSVNESPNNGRDAWRKGLGGILKQVRRFPHVGLVVSCRDPFSYKFPAAVQKQMPYWEHRGFENLDKAQQAYLNCYGVSPSDIPLMGEDVARPLALRIICEEISKLPRNKRQSRYDEIVSGQVGINAVFERYIKNRARIVGRKHTGLSARNHAWNLIKKDLAGYLAKNLTNDMPEGRFLKAVRERCSIDPRQARKILGDMANEGIINRTSVLAGAGEWVAGKRPPTRAVVRMPFQWFGDHIVARELLRNLNTTSAETVRESFAADKPLGKIFLPDKFHEGFPARNAMDIAGWREALILAFPERVAGLVRKKQMPKKQRELLFNLPDPERMRKTLGEPFMSGLHMRAHKHITTTTVQMVDEYFRDWENMASQRDDIRYMGRGTAEFVLSLSRRRSSRLSARRYLYSRHVKPMKMSDRDILWGSVAQQAHRTRWTHDLFTWLDGLEERGFPIPVTVARNYIALLSLFLGTPDRPLRNRATQALVAIGGRFPAALFSHTLDTLDFDDIYYPERMLAASYGTAMSLWNNRKAKAFRSFRVTFPAFANAVVKDVFTPGGRLLTHHAAVRDYALGIASIARKLGVKFPKATEKYMAPPFPAVKSPFPPVSALGSMSDNEYSFHHNFENYTIGALFPDRGNYNFKHKEYAAALRQIKWRIKNLGYDTNKFKKFEQRMGMFDYYDEFVYGKIDRHQKKYLWIAYYEKHGLLDARGKLPDWLDARAVDGVIDPSFPVAPRKWVPEFNDIPMNDGDNLWWITDGPAPDYGHILEMNDLGGILGPWVLSEGFVVHGDKDGGRELFSFLRGIFVQESDIDRLTDILQTTDYPGNFAISHIPESHRICAGEIPWASNFIQDKSVNDGVAFRKISIGTTAFGYGWAENYSEGNQNFQILFPSPDICAKLRLSRSGRGVDLVDMNGLPASLYRADEAKLRNAKEVKEKFQFLYLRKDLLDKYLRATDKRLVWIIWGERQLSHNARRLKTKPDSPEIQLAYQNYRHIHKQLIAYPQRK